MKNILIALLLSTSLVGLNGCYKADLEKANEEVATLKADLRAAEANLAAAKTDLASAKAQLAQKPDMPVKIALRSAKMGNGSVAMFSAVVKPSIPLGVTVSRPKIGTQQVFNINLGLAAVKEIGHMEGWAFQSGDVIEVRNDDYNPMKFVCP